MSELQFYGLMIFLLFMHIMNSLFFMLLSRNLRKIAEKLGVDLDAPPATKL